MGAKETGEGGGRGRVLIVTGLFFLILAGAALLKFHRGRANFLDLGWYHSITWNMANGFGSRTSFVHTVGAVNNHFNPILWLAVPFYWLHGRAETLIVLQSFLIAMGFPVFFALGKELFGTRGGAWFLAAVYASTPSVFTFNQIDVHPMVFAMPALGVLMLGLLRSDGKLVLAGAVFACLCKEDLPLTVGWIGFLSLCFWPTRRRMGAVLMLGAWIYLLLAVQVFLPWQTGGPLPSRFTKLYPHLGATPGAALGQLLSHPVDSLVSSFTAGKLRQVMLLLAPSCGLALIGGEVLLCGLPFLAYSYLAKDRLLHVHNHYVSVLIPFLVVATGVGLRRLVRRASGQGTQVDGPQGHEDVDGRVASSRSIRGMAVVLAAHVILWIGLCVVRPFDATQFARRSSPELFETLRDMMPESASLWTQQFLLPYFAERRHVSVYPRPDRRIDGFDLILLDFKAHRQPWNRLGPEPRPPDLAPLLETGTAGDYEIVFDHDGILLLRRTSDGAAGERTMGRLRALARSGSVPSPNGGSA